MNQQLKDALEAMHMDSAGVPWDWTLNELRDHLTDRGMFPGGWHEMPHHLWERLESIEQGIANLRDAYMTAQAEESIGTEH